MAEQTFPAFCDSCGSDAKCIDCVLAEKTCDLLNEIEAMAMTETKSDVWTRPSSPKWSCQHGKGERGCTERAQHAVMQGDSTYAYSCERHLNRILAHARACK